MGKKAFEDYPDTPPCTCKECVESCERPCWGTPQEISHLLDLGLADKLMLDWWESYPSNIYIVCPANPGHGGRGAPEDPWGFGIFSSMGKSSLRSGCIFQDKDTKCALQEIGKPAEARKTRCDSDCSGLHEAVARTWDTDKGRAVVERWRTLVDYQGYPASNYSEDEEDYDG